MRTLGPIPLLPLAAALLLAGCGDTTGAPTAPVAPPSLAAAGAVTEQLRVPLSGTILDPCAGQLVTFSGTGHFVFHQTVNDNGVVLRGHFNAASIKGVGEDGTRYVGSEASNDLLVLHFGRGSLQQSSGTTFRVTSVGSADDFMVHAVLHVTLNAAGEVTAVVDRFTAVCTG